MKPMPSRRHDSTTQPPAHHNSPEGINTNTSSASGILATSKNISTGTNTNTTEPHTLQKPQNQQQHRQLSAVHQPFLLKTSARAPAPVHQTLP